MSNQLTDEDYRRIRLEYPDLSGRQCLGLVSYLKEEVVYVKSFPNLGMEVAFVLNYRGHFSLYNKVHSTGVLIKGEGSYNIGAPLIQSGFSLKSGGRLYELIGLKINNDHYGNLLYQQWSFHDIWLNKKNILEGKPKIKKPSEPFLTKFEATILRKKQRKAIALYKANLYK